MENEVSRRIAILGGGNIARALVEGWLASGIRRPGELSVTRRRPELLQDLAERSVRVLSDNREAVREAGIVVLAVQPGQLRGVLEEIGPALDRDRHLLVSVVSGASIDEIRAASGSAVPVVRAMPNTGIAVCESMTCLAADEGGAARLDEVRALFDAVGRTLVIQEEMMTGATALCACGIAFFLRSVRAASQGGTEIGFHPEEAMLLAAQTAKGAASLLVSGPVHPEREIDRVTTPRGCTIAGLNEMEHHGFSSAFIKAILVSARKAERLYRGASDEPAGRRRRPQRA